MGKPILCGVPSLGHRWFPGCLFVYVSAVIQSAAVNLGLFSKWKMMHMFQALLSRWENTLQTLCINFHLYHWCPGTLPEALGGFVFLKISSLPVCKWNSILSFEFAFLSFPIRLNILFLSAHWKSLLFVSFPEICPPFSEGAYLVCILRVLTPSVCKSCVSTFSLVHLAFNSFSSYTNICTHITHSCVILVSFDIQKCHHFM